MENKFRAYLDDDSRVVVNKIANQLESYGLELVEVSKTFFDDGESFIDYEIKPLR
jgi:hypothetical protein